MTCDDVRRLLSERFDEPLRPEQAAQLRAHLATCAECRAFDRTLSGAMNGVGMLPRSQQSERVRQEVFRYVLLQDANPGRLGGRGWFRQLAGFAAATVVLVAFAAVLAVILNQQAPSSSPAGQPPTNQPSAAVVQQTTPSSTTQAPKTMLSPVTPSPTPPAPSSTPPQTMQGFTATPMPSSTETAAPTPVAVKVTADAAQRTVEAFYQAINQRDYASAYALFSDSMKEAQDQDEADFAGGYQGTASVKLTTDAPQAIKGQNQFLVPVVIVAAQSDGTVKTFAGSYTVGAADGEIKIVGASITEQGTDATPTETAPATDGDTGVGAGPNPESKALPACGAGKVLPSISGQNTKGGVVLDLRLRNQGSDCHLNSEAGLTITTPNGKPLKIEGNGLTIPLDLDVPATGASQSVVWRNWCGAASEAIGSVKLGSAINSTDPLTPPACVDQAANSTLSPTTQARWSGTISSVAPASQTFLLRLDDGSVKTVATAPTTVIQDSQGTGITLVDLKPGLSIITVGHPSNDGGSMLAAEIRLRE